tara:strand:- start:22 stop:888 length:867 start_codon:yes stop_codon:yes gene_type:complete
MSSEQLASAQNILKGNLAGAWDILSGAQGQYPDLGIARKLEATNAYSLRDIGATSLGIDVIRVRRDNDNSEQDFSASEVSDGTLEAFVGSGNNGFVRTWYDQSGNSNNLVMGTTGDQPKIVSSGSLLADGIEFNSGYLSQEANLPSPNTQPVTIFMVAKMDAHPAQFGGYLSNSLSAGGVVFLTTSSSTSSMTADGFGTSISDGVTVTAQSYYSVLANENNSEIRRNATRVAGVGAIGNGTLERIMLGDIANLDFHLQGHITELIFFQGDKLSLKDEIEPNMASYYGI